MDIEVGSISGEDGQHILLLFLQPLILWLLRIIWQFYGYLAIVSAIGIPLLICIGYAHQKKTASYKAEADIYYESNPHALRTYNDVELLLQLNLKLVNISIMEYQKNDNSNEKLDELIKIKNEIEIYFNQRKNNKKVDIELFKKFADLK